MTRKKLLSKRGFVSAAARWAAIVNRDAAADGCFVFAVRTTGVFCRPSCRSRSPLRRNVRFFDDPTAAIRAGFRPCLRCRPTEAVAGGAREAMIRRACHRLENEMSEPTLRELAADAGLSPYHFQRTFKALVGLSPKQYAKSRRFDRFRRTLRGASSVTGAIYDAGFRSPSRAYDRATRALAMLPGVYRRGGAGETIDFAIRRTALGWIIVAGTPRGVAHIAFGDAHRGLRDELRRTYPAATLHENGKRAEQWVRALEKFVENPALGLRLPLDLHGTEFQRKVWEAIARIPPGKTLRYAQLAAAIGMPRAARAVAAACAANRVAMAIPCHRVVPGDPAGGGYRWGLERKKNLLAAERSAAERQEQP